MPIFKKNKMSFLWLALITVMFFGNVMVYGEQQLSDDIAGKTLELINLNRVSAGFKTLSVDPRLNKIAEKHVENMAENNTLAGSNAALETPFEKLRSSGLTDINNLIVVARAETFDLLKEQLESEVNLSKLLSSEMTHVGIGVTLDSAGELWLAIYMTERAITLTHFTLSQSDTNPVSHSITIKGNTAYKNIRLVLVPPEDLKTNLVADRILHPDSNGNFETDLNLGTMTGSFDFEFYVEINGVYKLKNFFNMGI